jgi:N-acetyl sugar amidotransferase
MKISEYMECSNCVLSNSDDPQITFDEKGVCIYCNRFYAEYGQFLKMPPAEKEEQISRIAREIKADGKRKKYDCICGISGGVDSSFLAVKAKELGLNALLVHFDNGWNSELAAANIQQVCQYTGFDFYTYVVDWEEFKQLQLAYIRSGVLDWEVPTDHGLWAVILRKASELNVKHILIGANYQTEGILPDFMRYDKADLKNIKDIYWKFSGRSRFRSFPTYKFWWQMYLKFIWGLKLHNLLYYMEYNKVAIKKHLTEVIGWRDYGGKHYESVFTRFYQGYVLKEKFGVDKRKAHLASMICSGQMNKEEARAELAKPAIDPAVLEGDLKFFMKKMNISAEEFERIMKSPPVPHERFRSYSSFEYPLFRKSLKKLVNIRNFLFRR